MANKKYDYEGSKKVTSIRLSDLEKEEILKVFGSIQEFIQYAILQLDEIKGGTEEEDVYSKKTA